MSRYDKLLTVILRGQSDASIRYQDLCALLRHFGFDERSRGSHLVFFKPGIEEILNLQKSGNNAKPYQVRQVRNVIIKYAMEFEDR